MDSGEKWRWAACLALLGALSAPGQAGAQQGRIQGQVLEAGTRAPLAGASVWVVGTSSGALSNADGHFVLTGLGPGPHTLQVSFIGYEPARLEGIEPGGVAEVVVELVEKPISLAEITITPGRFAIMGAEPASSQTLTQEEIQTLPQVGEDIYRAVVRLPGIASSDFSAKFTVRGGEHSEVLVLLDGLELADPFHLKDISGGALSIVDAGLIEGIELLTGGFPAEYGDRRGGVFNIRSSRALPGGPQAAVGLSLMNARALVRGASAQGNWTVSARRGYLDLVLKLMGEEENFSPVYYDLMAKVERRLDERHTLAVNFLGARDDLDFVEDDQDRSNTAYETTYAWLTLGSTLGSRLLAQTLLAAGQGAHQRRGLAFEGEGDRVDFSVADERDFAFWELKQDWSWEVADRLYLKWGGELRQLGSHYDYMSVKARDERVSADSLVRWVDTTRVRRGPEGHKVAAYLAGRFSISAPLKAEFGLRWDRASYARDHHLSPRFNLAYALGKQTALRGGWGYFYQSQGIHELRVEDGEERFYPAERAEHWVAGLEHRLAAGPQLRVEGYYKKPSRLRPVYRNWLDQIEVFPELQDDRVRIALGGAVSKGIEFYLKQEVGSRFTWWASYALAQVREGVEGVRAEGVDYPLDAKLPGRYDQRHTLYLDANWRAGPGWHLNLAWQYRSGWPYTEKFLRAGTWPDGSAYLYEETGKPYGQRYPAFHRLDLRLNRHFDTSRGRISAFLEVINLYNRGNVRTYEYDQVRLPTGEYVYQKIPEYWFRLLPSIGASWSWDY